MSESKVKRKVGWFEYLLGIPLLILLLAWCDRQEKAEIAANPAKPESITVHTLVHAGSTGVFVWRDSAAMDLASKLTRDGQAKGNPGMHRDMIIPLVACIPENGSGIIKTDGDIFISTIRVIDGPTKGCAGVVENDFVKAVQVTPKP